MSDDGEGYVLLADSVNRGYQGGSLVGVLGVGPLVAYRLARRGDVNVLRESVIACGKSAGVGIALGGTAWRQTNCVSLGQGTSQYTG